MSFVAKLFTPVRLAATEGYKSSHGFHGKKYILKIRVIRGKAFHPARLADTEGYKSSHGFHEKIYLKIRVIRGKAFPPRPARRY